MASTPVLESWGISKAKMTDGLIQLSMESPLVKSVLDASESGVFIHDDGLCEELGTIRPIKEQLALLAYLARGCESTITLEAGFGAGMTTSVILAARASTISSPMAYQVPQLNHYVFDPHGLGDSRGEKLNQRLMLEFPHLYRRLSCESQWGMMTYMPGYIPFIHIDGGHRFEEVMADFYAADHVLACGGYITFDDALFPPIETVINYVGRNRPDYEISNLEITNTAILRKVKESPPSWDSYHPFLTSNRHGWTVRQFA